MITLTKNWKKILLTVLGLLATGTFTITILSNNTITINSTNCKNCVEYTAKKKGFECKILVLGQYYSWKLGDSELSENDINISQIIPSKLNQDGLNKCVDIVAIGTASEEIEKSIEGENDRARKRANNIIRELVPVTKKEVNLYELVLGKYNGKDDTKSYMQRRIIVIGILEKNEQTFPEDLKWALMQNENNTQLNILDYELFELKNTSKTIIK
jgi:hypothetical protein